MFSGVRDELRKVVGSLDPEVIEPADAARCVDEIADIERLVSGAKILLARRAADAGLWRRDGERSAAHWLAKKTGSSVGGAQGVLDTADQLDRLPETQQAIRDGKLSEEQATLVASAATADPDAERKLLDQAPRDSLVNLRNECDKVKAAADPDENATRRRTHAGRSLRTHRRNDGSSVLQAQGPADAIAELLARLQPFEKAAFEKARTEGRREAHEAYKFDALMAMARASSGEDTSRVPSKVIARIDHTALVRGHTVAGETCELAGVGPVPVSVVREMMDDAFLAAIVTNGVDVLNVAHMGRRPNAHQQTALEFRDRTCVIEGCPCTIGTEYEHHTNWAQSHVTDITDGGRMCAFDHDKKTYKGYKLAPSPIPGKKRLIPPEQPHPPPRK